MTVLKEIVYRTSDEREFTTEEAANRHEDDLSLKKLSLVLSKLAGKTVSATDTRRFLVNCGTSLDWLIPRKSYMNAMFPEERASTDERRRS